MKNIARGIKLFAGLLGAAFSILQLNGCATATAGLECGVESLNPTILAALDSFESAAISIKLSNRILLQTPTTELDKWPEQLYGAPTGAAAAKMGLSLLGSSQGVTIPTELDPDTGFPRPTSALYLFLKDRDKMLDKELNNDDKKFFINNPKAISRKIPPKRVAPDIQIFNEYVYRNPLMAFGVVNGNKEELAELQEEIDRMASGFTRCDKFLHIANQQQEKSAGMVKSDYCKDPVLTEELLEARLKKDSDSPAGNAPEGNGKPLSSRDFDYSPDIYGVKLIRAGYSQDIGTKSVEKTPAPPSASTTKAGTKTAKPVTKKPSKEAGPTATSAAPESPTASDKPTRPKANPTPSDPAKKSTQVEVDISGSSQVTEKKETLADKQMEYGKLAGRVHKASVAGADFTMAAMTKITCAIINGSRAFPNAKNEIEGWRGVYNAVMLLPRIKIIIDALGYYKANLGLQYTAYKTMYKQIKGIYPEVDEAQSPQEKQATETMLLRIETAEAALAKLAPKLQLLAEQHEVTFTDREVMQLTEAAEAFPVSQEGAYSLMAALAPGPS